MQRHLAISLLGGTLCLASCGDDGGGAGGQQTTPTCRAGDTRQCFGPGQCPGAQACLADGTGFGECVCGSGGSGNGGTGNGGNDNAGGGGTGGAGGVGGAGGSNTGAGGGGTGGNSGGTGGNSGGTGGAGGAVSCVGPGCLGMDPQGNCDANLAIDSADALEATQAIGLCQQAIAGSWGVVSADYVRSDGVVLSDPALAIGHGILDAFGSNVSAREGGKVLALSTGTARAPSAPGYLSVVGHWKDVVAHGAPPGFPKEFPACPGVTHGAPYDSAGLEVTIKTPLDAKSFAFDFDLYTYEFPNYICSSFNDYFVALLSPKPNALLDGNISFDPQGNTIGVNCSFLDVCFAQQAGGKSFTCSEGTAGLTGTGYDEQVNGSAATGWLTTSAPVETPGADITLRFAVWDSGDGLLDSTVLIDNFRFDLADASLGTAPVP